ncbi:hypothetical protein [Planomonospora sp. ID82291]|nr:hypothetical protein [Planomonospora sp. ID82291]MBG0818773.1 hypothetical protein [Planomonospora sp. ID82291]
MPHTDDLYNALRDQWIIDHPGVDPDDDPEFLRTWRRAEGADPETGAPLP